ncbi:MAG: exopolysaccharide biosynthesis protein, partial [Micavibrio sp.]|nr:exopolysaccharide biosynthesis protein [Micavibrio sp.]
MAKLSDTLVDLEKSLPDEGDICVFDIAHKLEHRGIGLLLFIFALPAAIPLPGLGINFIIAIPLMVLTANQMLGLKHLWLPKRVGNRSIKRETLQGIFNGAMPYVKIVEKFAWPRLQFLTHQPFKMISGI